MPLLAGQLGVEFFNEKLNSLCMSWLIDQVRTEKKYSEQIKKKFKKLKKKKENKIVKLIFYPAVRTITVTTNCALVLSDKPLCYTVHYHHNPLCSVHFSDKPQCYSEHSHEIHCTQCTMYRCTLSVRLLPTT